MYILEMQNFRNESFSMDIRSLQSTLRTTKVDH